MSSGHRDIIHMSHSLTDNQASSMGPSRSFQHPAVKDSLQDLSLLAGVLNGILLVTHPGQHQWLSDMLEELFKRDPSIATWPFISTACQFIANRDTLYHRDQHSCLGFYDLLMTFGDYGLEGFLGLRSLGVSLPYDSGTVVLLLARLIEHGVPRIRGQRFCLSLFNRADVCKCCNGGELPDVSLPDIDDFVGMVDDWVKKVRTE